ncbi:MAG: hypothetical protein HY717_04170 [Planctomycetes bacterium]|nr:hypothetical protein [Planctomycetota bacterium]
MERTGMKFIFGAVFAAALGSSWIRAEDFHDWVAIHSIIGNLEKAVESYAAVIDNETALTCLRGILAQFDKLNKEVEDLQKSFPGSVDSLRVFARGGYHWPTYRWMINGVLSTFMDQLQALKVRLEALEAKSANPRPRFTRGDVNADGGADLTDAIEILKYKFLGTAAPDCTKAADVDDSGEVDQTDAINLLIHLFRGGPAPEEPRRCGADPTPDSLSCRTQSACVVGSGS